MDQVATLEKAEKPPVDEKEVPDSSKSNSVQDEKVALEDLKVTADATLPNDPEKARFHEQDDLSEEVHPTKYGPDGAPIIETGYDVSRFLVSLRDDGDESLTFRSCLLGTFWCALNNVTDGLFSLKPTSAGFEGVFLMLILYVSAMAKGFADVVAAR